MFPKKHRLNLRSFPNFFQKAQKYHLELFNIYYQIRPDSKHQEDFTDQATVIARKKDFRQAVLRQQVTRKARAALAPLMKEGGLKMAVVLKSAAHGATVEQMKEQFERFFSKQK